MQSSHFELYFALLVGGFCCVLAYYLFVVVKEVKVDCKDGSKFRNFLSRHVRILEEKYYPPIWCFGATMQIIVSKVCKNILLPAMDYQRSVLVLNDGGEVALDWFGGGSTAGQEDKPVALFLPGVTGDSQSDYMKNLVKMAVSAADVRCVVFNYRGHGGVDLKTPRIQGASNTEDLVEVVVHIRARFPAAPLVAVAVSMGGLILGHYLRKDQETAIENVAAAFMVSAPFDVHGSTENMERWGMNMMINKALTAMLIGIFKKDKHVFASADSIRAKSVLSSRTVRQFHSSFTAPNLGFVNVDDYYDDATLIGRLNQFKVPVLAIMADDDPFQPPDLLPRAEVLFSNKVAVVRTKYGSHCTFMEGWNVAGYSFSDRLFGQYLKAVLENLDEIRNC